MQNLKATTSEVVHLKTLWAVHYKPLQEVHSIRYSHMDGNRINYGADVTIGNHCWIGEGAKILKGVTLEHDNVVGTGAIVTKSSGPNVLLSGVPARVIKENISWNEQRK